jgi:branched-chain amino acid transport system substrate-binding protein
MTGEQTRWGLENLKLDAARIKEIGFEGLVNPLVISCNDHEGVRQARIFQWDGKQWVFQTEWLQADLKVIQPMYADAAKKYAVEKKITPRECNKES